MGVSSSRPSENHPDTGGASLSSPANVPFIIGRSLAEAILRVAKEVVLPPRKSRLRLVQQYRRDGNFWQLVQMLERDPSLRVKNACAMALRDQLDAKLSLSLAALLRHRFPSVRYYATLALHGTSERSAQLALLEALKTHVITYSEISLGAAHALRGALHQEVLNELETLRHSSIELWRNYSSLALRKRVLHLATATQEDGASLLIAAQG